MYGLPQSTPRTSLSYINAPIHFVSGQFQGRCMRIKLVEIQKADLGRKYARVDRRPLDPPPVVQLKLFHVYSQGTDQEYEHEVQNYNDIQNLGLLCNVDLFPVPPQLDSTSEPLPLPHFPYQPPPVSVYSLPSGSHQQPLTFSTVSADQLPNQTTEDLKYTRELSGATFVQSVFIDYQGKRVLVFPFADLAVKIEGDFFLRYRVFDLFSRTAGLEDVPVLAECTGGSFHIYSTKEFPGLKPSTDLSKQLSRYGVRLNTRETERKRKKRNERSATPSRTSGDRGGKNIRKAGACD